MMHLLVLPLLPALAGAMAVALRRGNWRATFWIGAAMAAILSLLLVTGAWAGKGGAMAQLLDALGSIALMIAALLILVGMEVGQKLLQRKVPIR